MAISTRAQCGEPVLVADDDPVARSIIAQLLKNHGYAPICVQSAEEAWEELTTNYEIRLLICDWYMPGMKGPELIAKLRALITSRYIYSILITAQDEKENYSNIIATGADDFLRKPIEKNEILGRLNVAQRITRLQAELGDERAALEKKHLELTKALYEKSSLIESIPLFLITCDTGNRITSWSKAAESVFSLAADSVILRSFDELPINWNVAPILTAIGEVAKNSMPRPILEHKYQHASGDIHFLDITVSSICDETGHYFGALIIGNDVTERINLINELERARKLESIGQLASGISHEINTPMQFIGDNVRWVYDNYRRILKTFDVLPNDQSAARHEVPALTDAELESIAPEIPRAFEQTIEGINRVAAIIKAMKDFSYLSAKEPVQADLNRLVRSTATLCQNEWKAIADFEMVLEEFEPNVTCFPGELSQALMNLMVNAAHAVESKIKAGMYERGKIFVSTQKGQGCYEIKVSDDGIGIEKDIQSKIFDPFFTTKEIGKGTGQGLSVCHSVISKLHRGKIELQSEAGRGAAFTLIIPDRISAVQSEASEYNLTRSLCS